MSNGMKAKKYPISLFWYEKELPLLYVIKQCSERFGSLEEGLYMVADALRNDILRETANGHLTLA